MSKHNVYDQGRGQHKPSCIRCAMVLEHYTLCCIVVYSEFGWIEYPFGEIFSNIQQDPDQKGKKKDSRGSFLDFRHNARLQ